VVDDTFLENVLTKLRSHPDITIRPTVTGKSLSADQEKSFVPSFPQFEEKLAGQSLFASEERIWQELTGHSVDHSRISPTEFDCLVVIAAAGPDGLLQKHVTERTGQDKRSVPKRTERLAKNGYITKEAVVGEGARTSNLKLKKFSQLPTAPALGDNCPVTEQSSDTRSIIFYDVWFDATMKMLQDNNNIVPLSDIRVGLKIDDKPWETRRYFKCIRRLIIAGCLRTVSTAASGEANGGEAKPKRKLHKNNCLELLREPTAADRKAFQSGTEKNGRKTIIPDHEEDLEQSDSGDITMAAGANGADIGAGDNPEDTRPTVAPVARWTPLVSLHNQVFDLVDSAGPQGLTSKQICEQMGGASWHRPMDEALAMLTDIWQHSQPPHLRHLTLVRDTIIDGKSLVYHFRSLENYDKAVAAGQAAWEAIIGDDARAEFDKAGRAMDDDFDQWGFPPLDRRAFVRGGRASLTECGLGLRTPQAGGKARKENSGSGKHEDDTKHVSDANLPESTRRALRPAAKRAGATFVIGKRPDVVPSALRKVSKASAADEPLQHSIGTSAHTGGTIVNSSIVVNTEDVEPTLSRNGNEARHHTSHLPENDDPNAEDPTPPSKRRRITHDVVNDVITMPATASRSPNLPAETDAARRLRDLFTNRRQGRPTQAFLAEAERLRTLVAEEEKQRQILEAAEASRRELEKTQTAKLLPSLNNRAEDQHMHSAEDQQMHEVEPFAGSMTPGPQGVDIIELDDIADDAPEQSKVEGEDAGKRPSRVKRVGLLRSGGFVAAQREKVILDAVHACGGVFPGNNEMWYVMATAWQKLSSQTPDRQTLDRAIRNFIASGKLQKITWTFSDKKGFVHTRALLAEPHIMPQDPVVKAMQRKVEEVFPNQYLPEEVDVLTSLRHQASSAPGTAKPAAVARAKASHVADPDIPDHGLEHVITVNSGVLDHAKPPVNSSFVKQSPSNSSTKPPTHIPANGQIDTSSSKFPVTEPASLTISSTTLATNVGQATPNSVIHPLISGSNTGIKNDTVLDTTSLAARFQRSQKQYQNIPSGRNILPVPKKRAYRRRHNRNSIHPLSEGGEQWLQARSLMMGLACFAHRATGTIASRAMISEAGIIPHRVGLQPTFVIQPPPPSRNLRSIVNEIESSNQASPAKRLPQEVQDTFFHEVDIVETWEGQMIAADKSIRSEDGIIFINHTLKIPHVILKRARRKRRAGETAPILTPTEPAPGKKYRSRTVTVAPTIEVEEEEEEVPAVKGSAVGDKRKRRDRRGAANFADGERLIAAIALIMVVCGGINQDRLNWTLIAHALSFRYEGEFLRRRWNFTRRVRQGELENLRDAIREPFLVAYENGEIPKVDYQNLDTTDWPALLEWVEYEVMPTVRNKSNVDVEVVVQSINNTHNQAFHEATCGMRGAAGRKNEYFEALVMDHRKQMALHHFNGSLLPAEASATQDREHHVLLKSWIRAVALTKQWNYDAITASGKLSIFDEPTLSQVTQEMVEAHILIQDRKGRQLPGRNYQIHHDVLSQFSRWSRQDEHLYLRTVADARTAIDEHFEMNDSLGLVATAQDVEYLVLINMAGQGFITPKVNLPARNDDLAAPHPKLTKWSYGGNNYEMKNVKLGNLKFSISFQKTAAYTSDHGLQSAPVPSSPTMIFPGEPDYRLPIWIDVFGNRLDDVWDMVVRSILHIIVYRAGSTVAMIEAAHTSKLWLWEIDLVMSWMEAVGIAERCGAAEDEEDDLSDPLTGAWRGGWRASAWWYCAFLPEVADWAAPGGREIEQHVGLQLEIKDLAAG
jgi:hypothetical protein